MYVEVFMKPDKLETPICQHSVSEDTGNYKVQTLSFGAKILNIFLGGAAPLSRGGYSPPAPLLVGYVPEMYFTAQTRRRMRSVLYQYTLHTLRLSDPALSNAARSLGYHCVSCNATFYLHRTIWLFNTTVERFTA